MNRLSLVLIELRREDLGGLAFRSGTTFYDFVVDGKSVREMLRTPNIGVLSRRRPSEGFARQLLGETSDPELEGHAMIYGCRECLDVWCGGQAVSISLADNRVRWSVLKNFRMEGDPPPGETEGIRFERPRVGPFEFDATEYRAVFAPFLESPSVDRPPPNTEAN